MSIDPNNPVVKLCAEGIEAEMSGTRDEAARLYAQAWDARSNDYEACIVAHYMARVQTTPHDILHWNIEALSFADKVNDESVAAFYPSLYLNIGKAYEDMDNTMGARKYYSLGLEKCAVLPDDQLGNMTKDAIKRGIERVG